MERGFELFGPHHLATLAVLALAGRLAVVTARRTGAAGSRRLRLGMAMALAASHASEWTVSWYQGWFTLEILPLQLCDWAALLSVYGLVTLDRRAIEPLYFFALSGTLPALLTPELEAGFPRFPFVVYFLEHGLTVLAALLLVPGLGMRPRPGAWLRAFGLLNALAVVAALANRALGTNFMYLDRKPVGPTPFDWFGPWPYYLLVLEALVLAVFWLLDLPLRPGRRAERADSVS